MSLDACVTRRLDVACIEALIDIRFPQIHAGGRTPVIDEAWPRSARVRLINHTSHWRPRGERCRPALFTLADFAAFVAIIATLGEGGLQAVTSHMNINFLARPEPRRLET